METKRIKNGIVIDHIQAGKALELYTLLKLNDIDYPCIVIKNIDSHKMGKKDVIKIFDKTEVSLDIIEYFDSNITINIIKNGKISKIKNMDPTKYIKNVLHCENINCITSVEPEIDHIFKLTDSKSKRYSCIYCDYTI